MIKYILCTVLLFFGGQALTQSIQGEVVDKETKDGIPFAQVTLVDFHTTVQCNENGKFIIRGKFPETVQMRVNATGYETQTLTVVFDNEERFVSVKMEVLHLEIDEVTVTASGNELKSNSVSYVELKSIKELNELPKASLGQMLESIPGVYNLSTGPGISKPVIRGLQGTRVLTLLNGVRIEAQQWGGDHGMGISELGIGTIEVLKGPASLQYGADALGGVFYLSNEQYENQGSHSLTASSLFESNSMGSVSSLLYKGTTKNLKILAGGRFASHADYQIPDGRYVKNSRFQDINAKMGLGWHKGKWVGNLRYDWSTSTLGIPGHTHDSIPETADFLSTEQPRKKTLPLQYFTNHIASWENKFVLSKHTIQLLTAFTWNQLTEYDEKVTIPELLMNTYNVPYKLNVESKLKNNIVLTYGLQGMYLIQENSSKAEDRLVPDARQSDNGLYFLTSWTKNKWKLKGGARADFRSISSTTDAKFLEPFSKTYAGYNFSLGANYSISKKHILRLNATTGFRIPHLSELLSEGVHHGTFRYEIGDVNLTTEKALQLDLSYEYAGEHLSVVVNPFVNGIRDYIFVQPQDSFFSGVQVFQYQQTNAIVIQTGADLGLHWHPHFAHFLHVESTFSYLTMMSPDKYAYSLIPQPRWTNSISARFEMKSKFRIDNIVLQHAYYLPQRTVSPYETPSVDYSLLDLGVQCSFDSSVPVQLQFGVRNITNTSYINHLSHLKTLGLNNMGRSYYVKLVINLNFK